jgi:hypothetical protein
MTLITFTFTHWYAQVVRKYPSWVDYTYTHNHAYVLAYTYASAYAYVHAYDYAHAYAGARIGRYNLARATGGPQR